MNNFIKFLKKKQIVEELIEFYQVDDNNIHEILYQIIDDLRIKEKREINERDIDLISFLYENNVQYRDRKYLGEIYTPISIVKYILNSIGYNIKNNIASKKVIDISCGSGSFLSYATRILANVLESSIESDDKSKFSVLCYKNIISKIQENIYGVDINPIACILCQINIQYTLFNYYKIIKKIDENYKFPIFKIINENSFRLFQQINSNKIEINNFDFVVGNPPYLFIRDIPKKQKSLIENSNFITNKGQYDYYQLFIEFGLNITKNKGYMGYIVPDSLLALSNRKMIRKYIYNNTKIKEIYHTGPEFDDSIVSNVILIVQREDLKKEREENIIHIKHASSKNIFINEIIQKNIKEWDFQFLININDKDFCILNNLNTNFPKLRDIIEDKEYRILLSRGVELGKGGNIIYCNNCKKYYPIPKKKFECRECHFSLDKNLIETIIYKTENDINHKNLKPYIESISRYCIKKKKFIDISKYGINYKNLKIFRDRLIIRQLNQGNLICATYDKNLSLTSQSFYNLKIDSAPIQEFNIFYLLGLINSRLLAYYFIKSFGSYKILFPRILIEKIKQLPIKIPKSHKEKEIAKIIAAKVRNLLILYDKESQCEIDSLVFQLYNINRENGNYILNTLKNI